MKNVQICFHPLAASDNAIVPRLGKIKNSAKDLKCILQKSIKKKTNYYLVIVDKSFVYTHFGWAAACLSDTGSSVCGFFSTVSTEGSQYGIMRHGSPVHAL